MKFQVLQKVTVRVKIVGMSDSEEVKGLVKQEHFIADSSGFCKIIAWEENVGVFSNGSSYKLCGMIVRTFQAEKYLSISRDNFRNRRYW